jgi:hypothetical protein
MRILFSKKNIYIDECPVPIAQNITVTAAVYDDAT